MRRFGQKPEESLGFIGRFVLAVLIGVGGWLALTYVHHEREAGSALNQLRRVDEEAQKAGWIKASDGAWEIPARVATNGTKSHQSLINTNK